MWLDDFSARFGDQLTTQPEAEAAVHATIGRAYRRLGDYQSAETHLRLALDQRRRILGSDHPNVAQSLVDMALYLRSTGDAAEAEVLVREALAIHEKLGSNVDVRLKAYAALQLAAPQQSKHAAEDEISAIALTIALRGSLGEASPGMRLAQAINYNDLGFAYAKLGRWPEAAAALRRGVELDPADHLRWFLAAAACLEAGDIESYRRARDGMLERFIDTGNPHVAERTVKVCALVPVAAADLDRVTKLADRAVAGTKTNEFYRFFVLSKCLAEYRAGRYADAVDWVKRYAPAADGTHWDGVAFSTLALAHHHLDHSAEARAALNATQTIIARHMPNPAKGRPFGGDWQDWLHCQILFREAETLLGKNSQARQEEKAINQDGAPPD